MQNTPRAQILSRGVCYHEDPSAIYNQLCAGRSATLLLESAETSSKSQLKGLLVIDSALRITATGRSVTIEALTANGAAL
ncbi:MAG: anthranilate synthase component I, partial [Enterobacteriaceae bacterium]